METKSTVKAINGMVKGKGSSDDVYRFVKDVLFDIDITLDEKLNAITQGLTETIDQVEKALKGEINDLKLELEKQRTALEKAIANKLKVGL